METTNLLLPSTRMTRMGMVNPTFIEDAVIVSEKEQKKEHPNFIESNTSGITLEELETNCIVPSFGDNQLTISHQTLYTVLRRRQACFLQEKLSVIRKSESHTRF